MRQVVFLGVLAAALLPACGHADRDDEGMFGGGDGTTGEDGPANDDGGGDGGEDDGGDDGGGDDGGAKYDVDPGDGGGGGDGEAGCEKVDFLFVVDNSGSMGTAQQSLATSFPGFIATIREQVEGKDYHLMVVDSDEDASWSCEPSAQANDPACAPNCKTDCVTTGSMCAGYQCGYNATLDPADRTLGCGVVHPYGGGAPNRDCGVAGGHRYLTQDQPNLEDTFACVATTGVSGDWWEQPAGAMRAALSPQLNAAGGCNAGFLRSDAILVITFISDDVENGFDQDDVRAGFGGTPQQWYDDVVAAKGGNADAVVVLGVLATPDAMFNPVTCAHGGGFIAPKFIEFVDLFGDKGIYIDSCTPDYTPFFADAVELVDWTCETFVPEG